MSKLPSVTGKELIAALGKVGFHVIRVKGSHHFLRHPTDAPQSLRFMRARPSGRDSSFES